MGERWHDRVRRNFISCCCMYHFLFEPGPRELKYTPGHKVDSTHAKCPVRGNKILRSLLVRITDPKLELTNKGHSLILKIPTGALNIY